MKQLNLSTIMQTNGGVWRCVRLSCVVGIILLLLIGVVYANTPPVPDSSTIIIQIVWCRHYITGLREINSLEIYNYSGDPESADPYWKYHWTCGYHQITWGYNGIWFWENEWNQWGHWIGTGPQQSPEGTYPNGNLACEDEYIVLNGAGGKKPGPDPGGDDAKSKEPINVINGAVVHDEMDIAIDCPELPLMVSRHYNSQNAHSGPLGGQWMHSLEMTLAKTNLVEYGYTNAYGVMNLGGSERLWFKDNGTNNFASPFASAWTLTATTSGAYVARSPGAVSYLFDSNGVIQKLTGPAGNSLTFAHSNSYPTQLLVSITHDNQKSLHFEYATNRLARVRTDSTNLSLRYDYNAAGQLTGAVIFNGDQVTTTRYWYAASTSSWNGLTQIVNAVGHRFSYGYETNSGGAIGPRGIRMWADSNYYAHTVSYSTGQASTATITYDRGDTNQVWSYAYSPGLQRVKSIWGPVTNEGRIFTLDGLGFKRGECITNSSSGLYLSTLYTLDVRDNVNGMATGYGVAPSNWWAFTWDTNYTVLTSSTDPEGHRVEWEHTNGLVAKARAYPATNQPCETQYAYTTNGLLAAITNANGNWVRYGYDGAGNPTSIVPRAGPSRWLEWDELGHLQQIDLPSGEYTTNNPPQMVPRSILYDNDALGRVLAIGWPDETTETFSYDAIGNLTNHVDAIGRTNSFTWLPTRKLASKTRGSGSETVTNRYDYDRQLNTLAIRDEEGRAVESYVLDLKDRPVKVTNVESQEMTIAWALANMPQSMVRFDGTTSQYAYNQAGLLSGIVFPDQTISFKYYKNGLVMTASNQWGVISNAYDGANRLVSVAQPTPNGTIGYAYYPAGQVSNAVSIAGTNRYVLDEADRLAALIATRPGIATQAFEFVYNEINGLVSNVAYPNGVSCSYSYDVMDRVQSMVWRGASNQVLRSLQYGRNPIGMITNISRESGESSAYVYDSLDRLVEERKVQAGGLVASRSLLGYDRVGNRTNKTVYSETSNLVAQVDYVRGLGNRLSSWSLAGTNRLGLVDVSGVSTEIIGTNDVYGQSWVSNRYVVRPAVAGSNYWARDFAVGAGTQQVVAIIRDRAGNPGFATNTVVMAVVTNGTYQYNAAGCVTNIRYAGTDATNSLGLSWDGRYQLTAARNGTNVVERFGYDANGRMLWRWDGSETNWLVYDGFHVVAEVSGSGAVRKSYVFGPGVDNILSMTTYGATTNVYFYLKDHLGSVLAIADDSGAVVESYAYDAWGRVSAYGPTGEQIAASAIGNRICWQGREYSWTSGLYFFRARWYDPITGRWLSNDPIGISGGLNQYVFCANNPVNLRDPLGLCDEGGSYLGDSWRQLWQGNYYSGVPTALGLGAQITTGIFDIDLPGDIRDIFYDLSHWEWSWGHGGQTLLDTVGLLPVIGAVKYLNEGGDVVNNAIKRLSNGEIKKLIDKGYHPHDLKPNSKYDLFKDQNGNVIVRPKNGAGPGDPTGININNL